MGGGNKAGDAVASVAESWLSDGPLDRHHPVYRDFLAGAYGPDDPAHPTLTSGGTHCAIFARACLSLAGIKPPGKRPKVTAITTWLGVRGFEGDPSWRSMADLEAQGGLIRGDIPYWSADHPKGWQYATNNHVGVLLDGEGWMWRTAEGGGGPDGSTCRMSEEPKDVRTSHGRHLRGVWRPGAMPPWKEPEA